MTIHLTDPRTIPMTNDLMTDLLTDPNIYLLTDPMSNDPMTEPQKSMKPHIWQA